VSSLPLHLSHAAHAVDGGIATAVADLVAAQRSAGQNASWLTADRHSPWRRDRQLLQELQADRPSLLHIHGLWRSPTRLAPALAATGLPLLIAPHGMLDPWAMAQSRWKKRLVWQLWELRALEAGNCLHALCSAEAEAIRALGIDSPVAVIPNGVALPDRSKPLPAPPWAAQVPQGEQVLLFLGRLHAKKGTEPLLMAWRQLADEAARKGWWLALVGYGDGGVLADRVAREGIDRTVVLGPSFGANKEAALAGAKAFVLPSFSEGLPMAALEAMSWALPCLLSPACNLPEAFAAGAAVAVEPTAEDLERRLRELFTMPAADHRAMGAAGHDLVAECFAWPQVAEQCASLYRWILGGGERPEVLQP